MGKRAETALEARLSETAKRWAEMMTAKAKREGVITLPYPHTSAPIQTLKAFGFEIVDSGPDGLLSFTRLRLR